MMQRNLVVCAFLFAASTAIGAEDYAALFERALENIDWEFQDEWAYTESSLDEGELWIGRYNPRLDEDERWALISVDGREPTEKEVREYVHDRDEHDSASDSRTTKIVGSDSLELIEETDDYWLFTFVPDDEEEAFLESVDAKVKIIKAGPYVESIDIRNHSDIKPGFGTKLSKLVMRLEFGPATKDGPIVPQSIKTHVTGRALFFIGIDDTEAISHSDSQHVVE